MRGLSPTVEIVRAPPQTVAFDFHCPLMSLPLAFRTTRGTIPARIPYLQVEPERASRWAQRIGAHGFKIGLCWHGSEKGADQGRTVPLSAFQRIARTPGVRLVSLQKGAGTDQIASFREQDLLIEDLGDDFDAGPQSFLDCAAAMRSLDLVLTIDTSIAHLAGALGVRTWIALQHVPDWRWLQARPDSAWYPSVRLFRQKERGQWGPVLDDINAALRALLGAAPA
jgi:hypothetical protein